MIKNFSYKPEKYPGAGSILLFPRRICDILLENGHLKGDFMREENNEYNTILPGPCIAFDHEAQENLFDDWGAPKSIQPLLSRSYLAAYDISNGPELSLVSSEPLLSILPRSEETQTSALPYLTEFWELSSHPRIMKTSRWLKDTKDFCNRCGECDYTSGQGGNICQIAGCRSEFAWVKNGVVLFYLWAAVDCFKHVSLIPCRTEYKDGNV